MACCDTDLAPPQPPFPPPPGGANGCQQTIWACNCVADVDTWVLISNICTENVNCTGQLSCTPTDAVIELLNGCILGDAAPAAPAPWCLPVCCDPPASTPPPEETTPPPPDTYPPDETTPPPEYVTYPAFALVTTPPPTYPPDSPWLFCNCDYSSTWDCGLSAWSTPVLVGTCYEGISASSLWSDANTCDAVTTVSALGPCI